MSALTEMIKKSKLALGEKISCSLETLSPVHIGSGVKLVEGWDFVYSENSKILKIVSQDELLPTLSEKQLNEFNDDERRLEILSKANSKRSYKLNYKRGGILEFERNGNGMPYIPGSSFKGAVRTALFVADYNASKAHYNTILSAINANAKASAQWASTPLLEEAFGKDPNHNRMRMLVPSDIHFSQDLLEVSEVKILSLQSQTSWVWGTSKNPNVSLYPEHLKIGAKANFTIRIDEFLFKNPQAKKELNFSSLALSDIAKIVNAQSKRHLESEIAFFKKCGSEHLKEVIKFNEALLAAIPTTDTEFILRLSWGSGWKGMTGDYLDSKWLSAFREKFSLGKKGFPIFPKTRRLLVVDGKPKFTFGWVKVRLNHSFSETDILSNAARKEVTAIPANPANIPNAPEAKGLVRAVIIDDQSRPPKVKILEGEHAEKETIMPGVNLAGLGLKKDSNVFVKIVLSHNRTRIEKVEYKQKA